MLNLTGGEGGPMLFPSSKLYVFFAESFIHNGEVMSVQNY